MEKRGRYRVKKPPAASRATKATMPLPTDEWLDLWGPIGNPKLGRSHDPALYEVIGRDDDGRDIIRMRYDVARGIIASSQMRKNMRWDRLAAIDPDLCDPAFRRVGWVAIAAEVRSYHKRASGQRGPPPNEVPEFVWNEPAIPLGMHPDHLRDLWRKDSRVRASIRQSGRQYVATLEGIRMLNEYLAHKVHAPDRVSERKRQARSRRGAQRN